MKSTYTKLIVIACLAFSSSSVIAKSLINCDLLHGNWVGEQIDAEGNYSRWNASYSIDGRLELIFFDANGTQAETQEGLWECEEGKLSSTMGSGVEKLKFDYEILSLDQGSISYQSLFDGTVFQSRRLGD